MSVRDLCQAYRSRPPGVYWKQSLGKIMEALKEENHPDQQAFSSVGCMLMMNDAPCYWRWLDMAITKLIDDPTARLDPVPDLPDYDQMSSKDLVDKYEIDDENCLRDDILAELRSRYPLLIEANEVEPIVDLKERLKDVI
jgi:hypothetical protein